MHYRFLKKNIFKPCNVLLFSILQTIFLIIYKNLQRNYLFKKKND